VTTTQAAQQAITIAERLLDPAAVLAAVPGRPATSLQSLAGTALLHARLAQASPVFEAAAHAHWAAAATYTPRPDGGSPGLFTAPAGMAASLILAENYLTDPEPHRPAVRQAIRWLSARAVAKATAHHDRLRQGTAPPSWALYDVITGLAGTGRILLAALAGGHHHAEPGLIAALATLTAMINNPPGATRPGWCLPPGGRRADSGVSSSGVAETGMAHGIAGPLALLSTAATAGWTIDGQISAIRTAANWLLTWHTPGTATWPPHITGTELDHKQPPPAPAAGRRDAWCYGSPGISRALTAASHALNDPRPAQVANTALTGLAARPAHRWDTEGPALCHGTAGVLQSTTGHQITASADLAASGCARRERRAQGAAAAVQAGFHVAGRDSGQLGNLLVAEPDRVSQVDRDPVPLRQRSHRGHHIGIDEARQDQVLG
jgi:lantibiotic biosynthesis protein